MAIYNDLLQEKIDRTQPLDDQKIAKLNEKPNEGKGKDLTKSTVLKNSKITPKSDYIKLTANISLSYSYLVKSYHYLYL